MLKSRFGKDKEALELFKETYNFHLKNNYQDTYIDYHLPIVFALSDSYLRNNKIDSAYYYYKTGFNKSIKSNSITFSNYFKFESGLIEYKKKNYKNAIDSISKSLPNISKTNDLANVSYANFYLGKSFQKIGQNKKALLHFHKVDSIYLITKDIHPDLRESYEILIDHYKEKKELKNELIYIRKLLEIDRKLNKNYNSVNNFLVKSYDTPKLLFHQKEVIKSLKSKSNLNRIVVIFLIIIILGVSFFGIYHFRIRRSLKRSFEKALKENKNTKINKASNKEPLNVPKNVINKTLASLKMFEKNKMYLEMNITLSSLAKKFNTNTSYLSKVINHYQEMSFSNYINKLRIEYIIEELKTNNLYRKYTIKALANEIGFSNAESFSKAFNSLKGIKPSYFIKELNKKQEY